MRSRVIDEEPPQKSSLQARTAEPAAQPSSTAMRVFRPPEQVLIVYEPDSDGVYLYALAL